MASRLRAFLLAPLALLLLGCPEADGPGGGIVPGTAAPPRPAPPARVAAPKAAADVSEIRKNLEALGRRLSDQERRVEEARQSIRRLTDALERAREDSAASLAEATSDASNLQGRVEALENQMSLLRARLRPPAPADPGEGEKETAAPVGEPSPAPPVGAPSADAQIPAAGQPQERDAREAGLPSGDAAQLAVVPKAPPLPRKPPPAAVPGSPPDPEEDYARAVRVLRDERSLARARGLLQAFIAKYPTHELADDAQYWIGQSFFQERNFERAILAFNQVQVDYANGDKAPQALLLEALSFLNLGDRASARELLGRVISKYPDSSAARDARGRLESF